MIDTAKLNAKQRQVYEQFKDDPDFDMETALAKFAKPVAAVRSIKRVKDTNESVSRELRVVLEFLHRRVEIVQRPCIVCARTFAADYLYVAICSDTCRAEYIYREYGIIWDADKTERERWDGEPPSIIKPQALEQLKAFAKAILDLPTPADFIGRKIPQQTSSVGNLPAEHANNSIPAEPTLGATAPKNKSEVHNVSGSHSSGNPAERVKEVRASQEVQELKAKLASGEITKVEYQFALADLF